MGCSRAPVPVIQGDMSQLDIRIGTLVPASAALGTIPQILPHGFESFQLTFWQRIGEFDVEGSAAPILDACGDQATISSLGMFGNPLTDEANFEDWKRCIDSAHLYGAKIVAGFSGALEDRPVPESIPRFKEVWGELAQRAEDKGVRIAWENCDMGGTWERPKFNVAHSPRAWELLFNAVPSDALGLEWEPCHQMNSLIDPIPQLRQWIHKIYHLHGKDATIAWDVLKTSGLRGGQQFVWHRTPGFGDTNWTDVITILRMNGWSGAIDIEGWHDPVYRGELEMTGQVHGLNYLKNCRGGAFVANPV